MLEMPLPHRSQRLAELPAVVVIKRDVNRGRKLKVGPEQVVKPVVRIMKQKSPRRGGQLSVDRTCHSERAGHRRQIADRSIESTDQDQTCRAIKRQVNLTGCQEADT